MAHEERGGAEETPFEPFGPSAPYGVEAIGPFVDHYRLSVGGFRVPYLAARLKEGSETEWLLLLDERFAIEVSDEQMRRWLPFLAHAMAIAAGWTCFGENARPSHPFAVRLLGVSFGE